MNTLCHTYPVYEAVILLPVRGNADRIGLRVNMVRTHIRFTHCDSVYAFRKLLQRASFGRVPSWRFFATLTGYMDPHSTPVRTSLASSQIGYDRERGEDAWPSNLSLRSLLTSGELERGHMFGNPGIMLLTTPDGSPRVGLSDESMSEAFKASEHTFVKTVEDQCNVFLSEFWNAVNKSFNN